VSRIATDPVVDAIGYQCLIDAAEVAVGSAGNKSKGDEQKYMPPNVDSIQLNALHDDDDGGLHYCQYQVQGRSIHPNHARCGSQAE